MVKYRIVYKNGEFTISFCADGMSKTAEIANSHNRNIEAVIAGKDEDELFHNCRCWASNNIRGEFRFEPVEYKFSLS